MEVLRAFERDELLPAPDAATPRPGDAVVFWLADGCAGVIGRVCFVAEDGRVTVGSSALGIWSAPATCCSIIERAH